MTISELTAFITGLDMDHGQKTDWIEFLSLHATVESLPPVVLATLSDMLRHEQERLSREIAKAATELHEATESYERKKDELGRKVTALDQQAVDHLERIKRDALSELDGIEERAAREEEVSKHKQDSDKYDKLLKKITSHASRP